MYQLHSIFLLLFLLSALFSCKKPPLSSQAERPNIILIVTDDQGIGDLGVNGNPIIETPHIDAMAARSATLSRFYVNPVCSPTRACLMTGRYNYRTRVVDTWVGRSMMDTEEVTVAEVLRDAGYATGIFGKWHLGDCYPMRPIDQGFEEALVHKGGGLAQPSEPFENQRRYTDPILFHNGQQVQTRGYCTDVYVEAALSFIEKSSAAQRPFFAYIATNAPHGPFHDVPEDLKAKYQRKDLAAISIGQSKTDEKTLDNVAAVFAMVEHIDQNVGRLFAKLDALGLTENTLVIFMVDNGPNSLRYVMNLRGMKTQVHEGGIRSPFFAHWPARLKAGTSSDRIAAHIDLMPTLLEAAGVEAPAGIKLDGKSLLPLLEGTTQNWEDRTLFLQVHRGDAPIKYHHFAAVGQRYKLLHPSGFGREEMPEDVPFELYELESDPGESQNLIDTHPEEKARLMKAYENWFEEVSATRPDNYAKPAIIIGTDKETLSTLTPQDWTRLSGGGWGNAGYWKLEVASASLFDIEVRLATPRAGARAEVELNGQLLSGTFPDHQTSLSFEPVSLHPGPLTLKGKVVSPDGSPGPMFHVMLHKQ
ncbi:MAG: arylsulfatase [Bacteroidetes bacterium]|nr:MAG: arylsulfatase [Bacteroidota bacterium]